MESRATLQAERFYASAGFTRVGLVEVEFIPGVLLPAVEMERKLP